MADLTIDGEAFKVEVAGDPTRPVIMLSNALGTDLTMWDGQIEALTSHFRVIRYDTRGHGGSGGDTDPISIAQLGRDALAVLDALEIETTHWVGLSMGGAIGLWLLVNAPERIDRAVLANTAPRVGTPESWNARITNVLSRGMDVIAAGTMARWFSADFAARLPQRVNAIDEVFRKTRPRAYAACCAALRDMDLRGAIHSIEHDVLVLTGRDDPTVPPDEVAAFVAAIPGAAHLTLEAQHIANIEAEAAFNTAVLAFLTAKGAPSRSTARTSAPTKAAATKTTPVKRSRATLRSNAARNPLKKAATKRIAAKKAAKRSAVVAKKAIGGRRRPTAKATVTRRTTPKAAAKRPSKTPRKTATTRRRTPITPARVGAKATVKKAKIKVTKTPTKKSVGKVTKRLPATRRKPGQKLRRPKGRRTPR